jgi:hypothetical protein
MRRQEWVHNGIKHTEASILDHVCQGIIMNTMNIDAIHSSCQYSFLSKQRAIL